MSQVWTLGKNTKNRISCLNFFLWGVWICILMCLKYLRIWIIKSVWKNSMKMGHAVVTFNRSWILAVLQEQVKMYFNLKPSINIVLLPSLNDGHLYSASFDILEDMFLRFWEISGFALTSALTVMGECTSLVPCYCCIQLEWNNSMGPVDSLKIMHWKHKRNLRRSGVILSSWYLLYNLRYLMNFTTRCCHCKILRKTLSCKKRITLDTFKRVLFWVLQVQKS